MWTMRKGAFAASLLTLLGLCLGAAAQAAETRSPPTAKLLITGSSTMAPMITEFGRRFQAQHPGVQIEVQTGGSGRGIKDALEGKADIGMASRALSDTESSLYSFAVARDGICLVVHRDNPVRSLTNQQVIDIYTGNLANWSKVGGADAPIMVTVPREKYGSVDLFNNFYEIQYSAIKAQLVVGDNAERIRTIVGNPNAITFVSVGEAERQARAGIPIKLLPVDGVAATTKAIRSGNFPISRPLLLLTKSDPTGLVKEFIDFSLSSQVTDVIQKHDFVPYLD